MKKLIRKPYAKVNEDMVRHIRQVHMTSDITYAKLARQFNISLNTAYNIALKRSWKDVE